CLRPSHTPVTQALCSCGSTVAVTPQRNPPSPCVGSSYLFSFSLHWRALSTSVPSFASHFHASHKASSRNRPAVLSLGQGCTTISQPRGPTGVRVKELCTHTHVSQRSWHRPLWGVYSISGALPQRKPSSGYSPS
uniref:Uncharacterized protein n=1 Tax=Varanus komodoensis TaxID=61221 RepID=A0A8D2J1Y4_VARKO